MTETREPIHILEQGLLGALILYNDAIAVAASIVSPLDFALPAHGKVFSAMLTLRQRQQPVDLVTLKEFLLDEHAPANGQALPDLPDRVQVAGFVSSLVDGLPRVSQVYPLSRAIRQAALAREERVRVEAALAESRQTEAECSAALDTPQQ